MARTRGELRAAKQKEVPNVVDGAVALPVLSGCSFMVKSRACNRLRFVELETADDDIGSRQPTNYLFNEDCTIFILPTRMPNEGRSMEHLREVLDAEAVCLDGGTQQRLWRLRTDAATILTKLIQLNFRIVSCCVDDEIYTWTLVGTDEHPNSQPVGLKRSAVGDVVCVDTFSTKEAVAPELTSGSLRPKRSRKESVRGKENYGSRASSVSDEEFNAGERHGDSASTERTDEVEGSENNSQGDEMVSDANCEDPNSLLTERTYPVQPDSSHSVPSTAKRKRKQKHCAGSDNHDSGRCNQLSKDQQQGGFVCLGEFPFEKCISLYDLRQMEKEMITGRPNLIRPGPPRFSLFVRRFVWETISSEEEAARYTAAKSAKKAIISWPKKKKQRQHSNSETVEPDDIDEPENDPHLKAYSLPFSFIYAVLKIVVESWQNLNDAIAEAREKNADEETVCEVPQTPPTEKNVRFWLSRHLTGLRVILRLAKQRDQQVVIEKCGTVMQKAAPSDDDDGKSEAGDDDQHWREVMIRIEKQGPVTFERCRQFYLAILGGAAGEEVHRENCTMPPRVSIEKGDFCLGEPPFLYKLTPKQLQCLKTNLLASRKLPSFQLFIGRLVQTIVPIEVLAQYSAIKTYMSSAREHCSYKTYCRSGQSRMEYKVVPHSFTDAVEDIVYAVWYELRCVVYPQKKAQTDDAASQTWCKEFDLNMPKPPTRDMFRKWFYRVFKNVFYRMANGYALISGTMPLENAVKVGGPGRSRPRRAAKSTKRAKRKSSENDEENEDSSNDAETAAELCRPNDDDDDDDISIDSAHDEPVNDDDIGPTKRELKRPADERRKWLCDYIADDINFASTDVRQIIGGGGCDNVQQSERLQLPVGAVPMPQYVQLEEKCLLLGEAPQQRRLALDKFATIRKFALLSKAGLPNWGLFIRRIMLLTMSKEERALTVMSETRPGKMPVERQTIQLKTIRPDYLAALQELVFGAWYSCRRLADHYSSNALPSGLWTVQDDPPRKKAIKQCVSRYLSEARSARDGKTHDENGRPIIRNKLRSLRELMSDGERDEEEDA